METTRHFVATVYVVNDGATALHDHDRLGMWLPPGGHLLRDELPHEAARREVREETGLEATLVAPTSGVGSPTARSIPRPQQLLLEDVDVADGEVAHQHVDFVYYARVDGRDVDPAPGEARPEAWEWVTAEELAANRGRFEPDVIEVGREAIRAVDGASPG